jgi:FkbM family methyltransferase
MSRETKLVSIKNNPLVIYKSPECISDDIVKYKDFWEFELFNKWKSSFPKEGLVLDLGANIGSTTVQFKHYFPDLKIWAFEPYPENFNLLKINTDRLSDVHCFNVGVGSKNSMVHFSDGDSQNSGVVRVVSHSNNTNLVLALDTINIPEPVKMIKIDIEGHELPAFEGMRDLLLRDKPIIWVEDHIGSSLKMLKTIGYKVIGNEIPTNDYLLI